MPRLKESKNKMRCKKHPKHQQSPGVCSICLNEKLSRLSSSSGTGKRFSKKAASYASSSSSLSSLSSLSSSSLSSYSSPVRYSFRFSSTVKGSDLSLIFGKSKRKDNKVLTKSRSLAFLMRKSDEDNGKKSGFWSKLLGGRSNDKKTDELFLRSKTVTVR